MQMLASFIDPLCLGFWQASWFSKNGTLELQLIIICMID